MWAAGRRRWKKDEHMREREGERERKMRGERK
jgi:hypothetical protein